MNAKIDGLVMALASIIEEASTLECTMVNRKCLPNSSESAELSTVIDMFRCLLEAGRTVNSIEVEGCQASSMDWEGFQPQKGEVSLLFTDGKVTYTITIVQQSVHARGGDSCEGHQ